MNCSEDIDCSGSFACCRNQGEIGVADCPEAQNSLISEGFSLSCHFSPHPNSKEHKGKFRFFLCIISYLTLTFCSALLGKGEGASKGKFLLLIFTTGSPPKSKIICKKWTVTFIPRAKHHVFFWHSSYYFQKKSKHRLSEERTPQGENGVLLGLAL